MRAVISGRFDGYGGVSGRSCFRRRLLLLRGKRGRENEYDEEKERKSEFRFGDQVRHRNLR